MSEKLKGTVSLNGENYTYSCTLGEGGPPTMTKEQLTKIIFAATQKPGVNIKKGRIENIDFNNVKCVLKKNLINFINIDVENNYSLLGIIIAFTALGLLSLGGLGEFLSSNIEKLKSFRSLSDFIYFIGLLLLIVLIIIPYNSKLQSKLLSETPLKYQHTFTTLLILLGVVALVFLFLNLTSKPKDEELKETYGGNSFFNKFYYYIDNIFSSNVKTIITLAVGFVITFFALKIDITIPKILVILLAGTTIISILFGSFNGLLSFIQMIRNSKFGFNANGLTIMALLVNLFLFGLDIFNTNMDVTEKLKKMGCSTKFSFEKLKKILLHGDVFIMIVILISGIISLFRIQENQTSTNKFLSSIIFAIISGMVFIKNYYHVENMKNQSNEIVKEKLTTNKIFLSSMTGIFTDLLYKLYNVFFSKSQTLDLEMAKNTSIGMETNKNKSLFWLILYMFMSGFTQDNIITKYNSSVFSIIVSILTIGIGRLCLGTFSVDPSKILEGYQLPQDWCKKIPMYDNK